VWGVVSGKIDLDRCTRDDVRGLQTVSRNALRRAFEAVEIGSATPVGTFFGAFRLYDFDVSGRRCDRELGNTSGGEGVHEWPIM
jgi:hypothetical protein